MKERRPIVDMSQTFQNTNTAARHSTDRADELTLQDCTRGSDTGQTPLPRRNLPRSPLGPPTATSPDNPPERREKPTSGVDPNSCIEAAHLVPERSQSESLLLDCHKTSRILLTITRRRFK